ncbi:MAG: dihydrolipoyl dehydrogenase [Alphaproteobacteria bacterium]|jgi:dihydrolipoamide dehydrogenase
MEQFDVVVIGGGPGGYVAAIRAAQLGLKTACIEKRGSLGGTCLNVGCIPSKALLDSSEKYAEAKAEFAHHGIKCEKLSLDLNTLLARKDKVVLDLTKGIEGLFKKNKVSYFIGEGKILANNVVEYQNNKKSEQIQGKNIIIATGSDSINIPGITVDEEHIVTSTGALSLKKVPKKMIVIGAGYIGLEMGSVWLRLGAEVEVIEFLDRIVPAMDKEVAKNLQKSLEKQGMKFRLSTKVLSATNSKNGVELEVDSASGGQKEKITTDVLLVAIGRKAHTQGLGLEELGVAIDNRGRVLVNENFGTNVSGIYAIGDVIAGPMLAHKAEEEGVAVVELIAGQAGHVNYNAIPGVIYTWPEVATVGKTEEELQEAGVDYAVGKFPFMANSRARAIGSTEGFVKILACKKTDKVLGVHIIGPDAGTLIAEAVLAMEYSASAEDIARTCHAHPTLNEAVKEAALAVGGGAIHI